MGLGSSSLVMSLSQAEARLASVNQLSTVQASFASACDGKASGEMSEGHFCSRVFCAPFSPPLARAWFRVLAQGQDTVAWKGFCIGMAVFFAGSVDERLEYLFQLYDTDHDGSIDRYDLKNVLAADLVASALPAGQEVGKQLEATVQAALPDASDSLSREEFNTWARNHAGMSSLASWALAGKATDSCQKIDEIAAQVDLGAPLTNDATTAMVVSLKNSFKTETSSIAFLQSHGFLGSDMGGDERLVCEQLAASSSDTDKRLCWAFLGIQPPSVDLEHETVAWLKLMWQKQSDASHVEEDADKGKRDVSSSVLETSTEAAMVPPARPSIIQDANTRYLINAKWYQMWLAGKEESDSEASGVIDNSILLAPESVDTMRPNLQEDSDYVVVIPHVWSALRSWRGGGPALERPYLAELEVCEVYPLHCNLFIRRSQHPASSMPFLCDEQRSIHVSRRETIGSLKVSLCTRLGFRIFFVRLWRIELDGKFSLFDTDLDSVTQCGIADGSNLCLEIAFASGTWPFEADARVQTLGGQRATDDGQISRRQGSLHIGLRNLGNTCYLNAALQCLLATPGLGPYFEQSLYQKELNLDNPIGFGGRVAWAFGDFIRSVQASETAVVAPSAIKAAIGKENAEFAGFRQHDSQELLMWLVDSLHEDLNRVMDKPFLQDPDDDDANRSDADLAAAFWHNHKQRNDSIVVDLFHGQIKSSVECNQCHKISRKFDIFSSIGLPLPKEDMRVVEVLLHPSHPPAVPIRYGFRLVKNAQILDLKRKLYELCGIKPRAVAIFTVWNSRHDQLLTDTLDTVRDGETLHGYALATGAANDKLLMCNPPPRLDTGTRRKPKQSEDSDEDSIDGAGVTCFGRGGESRRKKAKMITVEPLVADGGDAVDSTRGNDDSDHDEALGGKEKLALDSSYVQVYHRRLAPALPGALVGNGVVPHLFGWPLLVSSKVVDVTTPALYAAVWDRVQHLVSPDYSLHTTDESGTGYPFRLSLIVSSGLACSVCPWTDFCTGCPLSDAHLDPTRPLVIGIDWSAQVLRTYFNYSLSQRFEVHSSVQLVRDQQEYPISLEECLELFGQAEQLAEYYCGQCKEFQTGTKTLSLFRLPPVLCFHLKRFQERGGRWEKTNKLVNFPTRNLNLSESSFSLYGTICHYGSLVSGHYTASTKLPAESGAGDSQWYYCDDSRFRPLEEEQMVVNRAAYVLFYASNELAVDSILAGVKSNQPAAKGPRKADSSCNIL